jgi:hypothetical protein
VSLESSFVEIVGVTYTLLSTECNVAGWLQNHDRTVYVHDRHTGYGAKANAQRVRLRCNHITVFVGLA